MQYAEKKIKKKSDILDKFISKKAENSAPAWLDENYEKDKKQIQKNNTSVRLQFLKKNIKVNRVLPPEFEEDEKIKKKFGYFETKFGTISVGRGKRKKSDVGFSIVPEETSEKEMIPQQKPEDRKNYFGGKIKKGNKEFQASAMSFRKEHGNKNIKRIQKYDPDGEADDLDEPLYQDEEENEELDVLKDMRNDTGRTDKEIKEIDKELEEVREIKSEKREDNGSFLKTVDKFMHDLKRNKIKKTVDADEADARRKRILKLSSTRALDLLLINRLLKKLKEEEREKFPESYLNNLSNEEIKDLIKKLREKI